MLFPDTKLLNGRVIFSVLKSVVCFTLQSKEVHSDYSSGQEHERTLNVSVLIKLDVYC